VTDPGRASALLEAAPDVVVGVDGDGIVVLLNAQAERSFGVSRTSAVGAPFPVLLAGPDDADRSGVERIPERDRRRLEAAVGDVLAGAEARLSVRYRVARAGGGFDVLEAHGQVGPDPAGHMLIICRDIGEHVRRETASRAARDDADRAEDARSLRLSRLGHQLRTPLNAIMGFGQLLELQELAAEDAASVQQVLRSGRHLLGLVEEVVDIARIERREPAAVPAATGRPAVVLLVEDDAANAMLAERLLQRLPGVRTIVATSGADGIALARATAPALVLLDLHLPDMRGEEVVAGLRSDARTREIPIIVLSAETAPGRLSGLRSAGVADFQVKPIDVRAFLRVVADTIGADPAGGV